MCGFFGGFSGINASAGYYPKVIIAPFAEEYLVSLIGYAIDKLNLSYILWRITKVEKHVSILFLNLLNQFL